MEAAACAGRLQAHRRKGEGRPTAKPIIVRKTKWVDLGGW